MVGVLQTFFLRSLPVSSSYLKFRTLNEPIRKDCLYFGIFNCTYGGPKQRCSVSTPLVVLGFMEEFHVQAGPLQSCLRG